MGRSNKPLNIYFGVAVSQTNGDAAVSVRAGNETRFSEDYALSHIRKSYKDKERETIALVIGVSKALKQLRSRERRIKIHISDADIITLITTKNPYPLARRIGDLQATKDGTTHPLMALINTLASMENYSVTASRINLEARSNDEESQKHEERFRNAYSMAAGYLTKLEEEQLNVHRKTSEAEKEKQKTRNKATRPNGRREKKVRIAGVPGNGFIGHEDAEFSGLLADRLKETPKNANDWVNGGGDYPLDGQMAELS